MIEADLKEVKTWRDLCNALRANEFDKAAEWIESWVDEYLPGDEDKPLPGKEWT